jgi:hypothetical protein
VSYSREHYARVNPAPDTPATIAARRARFEASKLALIDRVERYPTLTADNADEAITYQEARYRHHYAAALAAAAERTTDR